MNLAVGLVCAEIGRDMLGNDLVGIVIQLEDLLSASVLGLVAQDVSEGLGSEVVTWLIVS